MSRWAKWLAWFVWAIAWGLFFADALDRGRRVWDAPATAVRFWEVARAMFADASPLAWAILVLGTGGLLVATIELWLPLVRPGAVITGTFEAPYNVEARAALLYAATRKWDMPPNHTAQEIEGVFGALKTLYDSAGNENGLHVWGRSRMSRPLKPIEKSHWEDWHINYVDVFETGSSVEPLRTVPRDQLPRTGGPYFDLRMNKAEVESVWPPKT